MLKKRASRNEEGEKEMREIKRCINEIRKSMAKHDPVEAMKRAEKICSCKKESLFSGKHCKAKHDPVNIKKKVESKEVNVKLMSVEDVYDAALEAIPGLKRDDFAKLEIRLHKGGLFINPVLKTEDPDYDDFEYGEESKDMRGVPDLHKVLTGVCDCDCKVCGRTHHEGEKDTYRSDDEYEKVVREVFKFKSPDRELSSNFVKTFTHHLRDAITYRNACFLPQYAIAINGMVKACNVEGIGSGGPYEDELTPLHHTVITKIDLPIEAMLEATKNLIMGYEAFNGMEKLKDTTIEREVALLIAFAYDTYSAIDDLNIIVKDLNEQSYSLAEIVTHEDFIDELEIMEIEALKSILCYLTDIQDEVRRHNALYRTYLFPEHMRKFMLSLLEHDNHEVFDAFFSLVKGTIIKRVGKGSQTCTAR